MAFIDSLAGIASNLGLSKLAPANTDAIASAYRKYGTAGNKANIHRSANREAANRGGDYFDESFADYAEKASAAQRLNSPKKAEKLAQRGLAAQDVALNYRQAAGISDVSTKLDGTKLTPDQLTTFRKKNNEQITGYRKDQLDARKELLGHAKDYFFSGDMGTNAMRWGAAATAYGGVAVGTRVLTGGSATTNNQGRRDIAGIPFI